MRFMSFFKGFDRPQIYLCEKDGHCVVITVHGDVAEIEASFDEAISELQESIYKG